MKKKEKKMKKKDRIVIKLTQEAYVEGYEGAFLRECSENGTELATGWCDAWYTACAEDKNKNIYDVYWEIDEDYNSESDDESEACDWDNPIMVINKNGCNVLKLVTIEP